MGGSRRPHGEVQAYHPQTRRNRQVESAPGARHGPPSPPRRTDRGCTARYQEARNRKKKRTKIEHHLLAPQVCQAHLPRPVGGQRKRWRRGAYRHRHPHNAGTARSGHPRRRHHRQARAAGRCGGSSGAGGRHKRRRGRRPRDGDRRGGSGDKRHQSNGRGGIGGGGGWPVADGRGGDPWAAQAWRWRAGRAQARFDTKNALCSRRRDLRDPRAAGRCAAHRVRTNFRTNFSN